MKEELAAYQLKRIARVWHDQWKEKRTKETSPVAWEEFKSAFLDRFIPLELKEVKIQEFIDLYQ